MAWKTVTHRRPRTFVPDEAAAVQGSFRTSARSMRALAAELRSLGGNLEVTWEGHSKQRFMEEFKPETLESYAAWLEDAAARAGSISVTVWETYQEAVWEPDPTVESEG